jgi:hypothetical protein
MLKQAFCINPENGFKHTINFTSFLPKSGVVFTLATGLAVKIWFVTAFTGFLLSLSLCLGGNYFVQKSTDLVHDLHTGSGSSRLWLQCKQ